MPKLSKKELKALKKAKKEAEARKRERLEMEKQAKEAETQRAYVSKMSFLRSMVEKVQENPWLIIQEEDVGIEFLEAYSLAIRNSKHYIYHLTFPPEKDSKLSSRDSKEELQDTAERKQNDSEDGKSGDKRPKMPMAKPFDEHSAIWPLLPRSSPYFPEGGALLSLTKGISALQQLCNRTSELMMQIADFASTQPAYTFGSPLQLKYIGYAVQYFARLLSEDYVSDAIPDENITDDKLLGKDVENPLDARITKGYKHNMMLNTFLSILKPTLSTTQTVVLEKIPQFYPPEPTLEEKKEETKKEESKGKKNGKKKEKGKRQKGKKEEVKKNVEVKNEKEKREVIIERPKLPDIIKSELIDHLMRFAVVIYPKMWQEERLQQQAETKAREEAEKAAAERAKEEGDEAEMNKKKKKTKRKKESESKIDPRFVKLQISPEVPALVSTFCALHLVSRSEDVRRYITSHPMWGKFVELTSNKIEGYSNEYQVLAKEVVEAYTQPCTGTSAPDEALSEDTRVSK